MHPNAEKRPVVALFRAEDDSAETAEKLAALGFDTAKLPVIAPRALAATPGRQHYDAILVTSARAFLAPPPIGPDARFFVVGTRAERAAVAAGLRVDTPPARDAEQLAARVKERFAPGANFLYLAARDRKDSLEAALSGRYALETVEVYAAEAREAWRSDELPALFQAQAALHFSRRSARLAAELAKRAGAAGHFRKLTHVCLSRDAAEPITALGVEPVVSEAPDEPALLAALAESLLRSDRPL